MVKEQHLYSEEVKMTIINISCKRVNKDGKYENTIMLAWLMGNDKNKDFYAYRFITLRFPEADELFNFLNLLKENTNLSSVQEALSKDFYDTTLEYEFDDEGFVFKKVIFYPDVTWDNGYFGMKI